MAVPDVALESKPDGTTTKFVYGPTGPLQVKDGSTWSFLHQDTLGSTMAMSNAAGLATGTRRYSAFGDTWSDTGTMASWSQRFASATWDDETGLYFLKARYLDPRTAMFLSRDPIPVGIGSPHQSPYTYVWGQPTVLTDPTGMLPEQNTCGIVGWVIDKATGGTCAFSLTKAVWEIAEAAAILACGATGPLAGVCGAAVGGAFHILSNKFDSDPTTNPSLSGLTISLVGGYFDGRAMGEAVDALKAGRAARAEHSSSLRDDFCRAGASSFGADTGVLMADGTTTPISELEVGDQVVATDPETGETSAETVEAVWVHDDQLVDLATTAGPITRDCCTCR
ncbi:MAG TPA: RHS repeat-associated core domain-containing protein [Microthrixaceae bacterium]|jgi:RHS repeat-associated protein|nr:RHS repeat-associated core domain-containing protein [Microthrixaceae bacterium]